MLSHLSRRYKITTIDPSYFVLSDMREARRAIATEQLHLHCLMKNISNIGRYVQDEVNKITQDIIGFESKSDDDWTVIKVLNYVSSKFDDNLKRLREHEDLFLDNW